MTSLVEHHLDALASLCRRFHVRRLDLFGSAATGEFDPRRSDLDFLVEFDPLEPRLLADAYFGMLDSLQSLFKTRVDLVTPKAIRNPYFRKSVNETRRKLYGA